MAGTDVVITAHHSNADEVERSLVGTAALIGCGRVTVVDATDRPTIRSTTGRFDATYVVDPAVTTSTASVVHSTSLSELYVWISGGQVAMPTLLLSLAERFDNPQLATCQAAIGLLNADSLVHLRGGRDEEALLRDVIGPGTDRLGAGPWFGAASMIRRVSIEETGGFETDDPAATERALIRLHQAGWTSGFDARRMVRATAPDTLDAYLQRRNKRAIKELRIFRAPENPLRVRGLQWRHRLIHLATAMSFGTGVRQLVQLTILTAVLLTGQMPFDGPVVSMLAMWLPAALLGVAARRALGRGSMVLGDWVRHGWLTLGADVCAMRTVLGLGEGSAVTNGSNDPSGLASLGRLRSLTGAMILLELAVVIRALTLFDPDLLRAFSTGERIIVLAFALVALVPMIDVLQVIVLRRQRRRNHRVRCSLPIRLGAAEAESIDLAPSGVGLLLDSAPRIGAKTHFALTLPALDGTQQTVQGMAVVRAADVDPGGAVRVGLEFVNLSDTARLALIAYCAIGHVIRNGAAAPPLAAPGHLRVERVGAHQRSLQALTGSAVLAATALFIVGPAAGSALAAESGAIEQLCLVTSSGHPVPDAVVERRVEDAWQGVGSTGRTGCVKLDAATADDVFAVSHAGGRTESSPEDIDGSVIVIELSSHRVWAFDTAGRPLTDVQARYFTDAWYDVTGTDGAAFLVDALESPTHVELMWNGSRLVQAFESSTVVVLAQIRSDVGVDVVEIDRGAGWERFEDGMEVLPGRFVVRLADGGVAKLAVPGGYELSVPSGALEQLAVPAPAEKPEVEATNEPITDPTPTVETTP